MPTSFFDVPAYPGARVVCSEHTAISGGGEVAVSAYATSDEIAVVRAYYESHRGTATLEDDEGQSFFIRGASPADVVSVSPTGEHAPCQGTPLAADRTYFELSHMTGQIPPP